MLIQQHLSVKQKNASGCQTIKHPEPIFAVHHDAKCEVETEMLFMGEGAVTYFTPEGDIDYVLNAQTLKALTEGAAELDVSPS